MTLQQDLFTSAERRWVYLFVCGVVLKSIVGACIYIGVAKYILDIHALESDRSLLSVILLIVGSIWLLFTMTFAGGLLVLYIKRILAFSGKGGLCTRFERHVFFWTGLLLFAALCFSNPIQVGLYLTKLIRPTWNPSVLFSTIPSFVCETIFFTTLMLYAWVMAHGFRLEEGWSLRMFYLPKFGFVALLVISKVVVAVRYGLFVSSLPFASFFSMLKISSLTNPSSISSFQSRVVFAITVLEMLTTVAIAHDFARTNSVVQKRENRIGTLRFRFFVHRFALILVGMYVGYLGLSFFLNSEKFGRILGGKTKSTILILTRQEAMMVFMAYSLIEAFLNLPGRKYRIFLLRHDEEDIATLPVGYYDHEGKVLALRHQFVAERHVDLLNFHFVSYYLDGCDQKIPFDLNQALSHEGYEIAGRTSSASGNRCRAFVFQSQKHSKVIVCILSPSEFQPKSAAGSHPRFIEKSMQHIFEEQRKFSKKSASVHHGFVLMYSEIAFDLNKIVEDCLDEWQGERPTIFFTGHSLGGAVATISSIDIALRLGLSRREVVTGTFGAPCIGNAAFVSFYNQRVPLTWRVIIDGDMVVHMPGKGYFSTGLDAVLTDNGELVLDPSSLISPRVHNGRGLTPVEMAARHKRIAYLLAMRSWIGIHRCKEYKTKTAKRLWSWPVQPEDTILLPHYGLKEEAEGTV